MRTKIIIIVSLLVLCSCNNRNGKIKLNDVNTMSEANYLEKNTDSELNFSEELSTEDFNTFFTRFERDSIFQISRIIFPLEGYSTEYVFDLNYEQDKDEFDYFVKDHVFYWKKQGWGMIAFYDPENEFNRIFEKITEGNNTFMIEKITGKKENIEILLKYQLIDNKWYLVYYSSGWY